jgi:CheY-like chemotaxis protein
MPQPILLAEDNVNDIELITRALSKTTLPHEIVIVQDGEQALAYLLRKDAHANRLPGNPTLILLDIRLPKMDGIQVLQTIKASPELQSIPVVMFTASKIHEDLARAYRFKANAYVVKPTNSTAFSQAVQDLSAFWSVFNEPPPGSRRPRFRPSLAV